MLPGSASHRLVPRRLAQLHPSGKGFILLFRIYDVKLKEADEQVGRGHTQAPVKCMTWVS